VVPAACDADRSRTSFDPFGHACFLLLHGLAGHPSLRRSYAAFPFATRLRDPSGPALAAGTDELTLGFGQLAALSSTRPAAFLAGFVGALARQVCAGGGRLGGSCPPTCG
jgi:hypothetical protein